MSSALHAESNALHFSLLALPPAPWIYRLLADGNQQAKASSPRPLPAREQTLQRRLRGMEKSREIEHR